MDPDRHPETASQLLAELATAHLAGQPLAPGEAVLALGGPARCAGPART